MKKLLLVDGNSIMNRAFYGTQSSFMKNAEGLFTGALFGFMNILLKYLDEEKPEYVAVAFDVKAPTFRHKAYDGYKATRKGMPNELAMQMPIVKQILRAMHIECVELPGYEADDIIGTYTKLAKDEGIESIIITGDKDSLQLVNEMTVVKLPVTKQGTTTTDTIDIEAFKNKYGGLMPIRLIDLKALMGDSSDNIPGVPGVGEKTAVSLLAEYGSLDGVYAHVADIKKPALKKKIEENKDSAYMSYELATIMLTVPVEKSVTELAKGEWDKPELVKILTMLEFKSIIKKMKLDGVTVPKISRVDSEDKGAVVMALFNVLADEEAESENIIPEEPLPSIVSKKNVFAMFYEDLADIKAKAEKMPEVLYMECEFSGKYPVEMRINFDNDDTVYSVSFSIPDTEISFIEIMRPVFENKDVKKVAFDSKPIILWLMANGCGFEGLWCDLSIAAYLTDSTRKNDNFSDVCRLFTGEENSGMEYLPKASAAAIRRLERDGMTALYRDVELPLVPVLASFENEGFKVSENVLVKEGEILDKRIAELTEDIYKIAGREFNINSPRQLGEVLFDEMKLPGGKKTKTGYKTGQDVLEAIADESPIISLVLEYRQNVKLKSTYIDGLIAVIDKNTGLVHSSFNQTVTATGRLSSTEPNLQNIPVRHELGKKIRYAFVPRTEGNVLIDADYSQIELRVLAEMSGDYNMKKAFKEGADIHAITASQVNNVPLSAVTPSMRSAAKAVNFGIVYGISEFGLAKDIGISRFEAKKYINGYFEKYPGVKAYMDSAVAYAKENGYAVSLLGRRRYLPELTSAKFPIRSFGERVAMNMPIQGTAADIMKIAMIKVYREIKSRGLKAKLILQVHDELLIDSPIEEKDEIVKLLRECMENAFQMEVPLPVSVSCGSSWAECK